MSILSQRREILYKPYPYKLKPDVSSAKFARRITLMNVNTTKRKKLQFKNLVQEASA